MIVGVKNINFFSINDFDWNEENENWSETLIKTNLIIEENIRETQDT